jgi:hypothetical protein
MNLFIHVVSYPKLDSVATDMTLLDIAAGFFARLKYVSSGSVSFGAVKDLVEFADKTIKSASSFGSGSVIELLEGNEVTWDEQIGDSSSHFHDATNISIQQLNSSTQHHGIDDGLLRIDEVSMTWWESREPQLTSAKKSQIILFS